MAFRATAYQKRLEDAGFEPKMAFAQAAAIEEFVVGDLVTSDELKSRLDTLETKFDARLDSKLATLKSELKTDIATLQVSLIRWVVGTVGGATLAIILTLLRVAR